MTHISLLLLATTLAGQAQALTCIETDVLSEFARAHASPESYVVLQGRLSFDRQHLADLLASQGPRLSDDLADGTVSPPVIGPVPARFEGRSLGARGFTQPVAAAVTLGASCSMGCALVEPGEELLLFARPTEAGYQVTISDCGGSIHPVPDPATVRAMSACLRDGGCPAP